MFSVTNVETYGWSAAIRGMRNPMNSWNQSDTNWRDYDWNDGSDFIDTRSIETLDGFRTEALMIGEKDLALMKKLRSAGPDHGKFMRMIGVSMDITAMQPWWMEFDTYKVSTVRNSCSKMHKIHVKPFEKGDFATIGIDQVDYAAEGFKTVLEICERLRKDFNETQDRKYWRALIEFLPEGYLMRATVTLNYEVLRNMYHARKNHKLVEWHMFCDKIRELPYAKDLIC